MLGIGSVRKAASVGRVGGIALTYFLSMSTVALAIGLLVGNIIQPGTGLNIAADPSAGAELAEKRTHPAARWSSSRTSSRPRCCPR